MTKKEAEKYNKEVYDMVGNRLYPGDTVVIPGSYYHELYIGVVRHFAEKSVIVDVWGSAYGTAFKAQREPRKLLKIKDKDGDMSFMQNYPKI